MKPIFYLARHTLKSAWKFRLVSVLLVVLFLLIIAIPSLIKHNGTAVAFTQVYLTYTLGSVGLFLGFVTLWLACGTLAREVEECQMQVLATKPVGRWQIWLGKWVGIMMLNALLLALSGTAVLGLLHWNARQLSDEEQNILREKVLIARTGVMESPDNREAEIARIYRHRLEATPRANPELLHAKVVDDVRKMDELVPSNHQREWAIDLGLVRYRLEGQPLQLRVKFHAARAQGDGTFRTTWIICPDDASRRARFDPDLTSDKFHEFEIPPDLFDENGVLRIQVRNYSEATLLFRLDDCLEVLYREGGFVMNFIRGLVIMFCGLSVLATLGLASASFLSFPVAAFVALSLILMSLSTHIMQEVVLDGTTHGLTHSHGDHHGEIHVPLFLQGVDLVVLPLFRGILSIKEALHSVSPVDALSSGRSITWTNLLHAVLGNVVLLGGLLGGFGIWMFTRRELATAQGTQ